MDRMALNTLVEEYLNHNSHIRFWENVEESDAHGRFLLRSAKRLCYSADLYHANRCGLDDLMIALRDYLLATRSHIALSEIDIPHDNRCGIIKDEDGTYFASNQFPPYICEANGFTKFVEDVFQAETQSDNVAGHKLDLHTDAKIQRIFGYKYFKSASQKLAVYGALNAPEGYTTLISLPTGGGKSLITQALAYQKEGLTIVVVPTVSLAIDQVRVAKNNIKSSNIDEEIFSYSSGVNAGPILQAIQNKTAKLLFISPEALINNTAFNEVIAGANATRYLRNIVIDEAHIVVDWGASFRIDYQCLEPWRRKLMVINPGIRTVLLSATFEPYTLAVLKNLFSLNGERWIEIRCDSLRREPRYMVIKAETFPDKYKKMLELVYSMPHPMIIYVARPVEADELAAILMDAGIRNVRTFTGKTTSARRRELIDTWVDDQYEIMVATSAFGIGVDKDDVRTVLHMYIPQNANAYYQELGRGGRDQLPCLSIMCYCDEDLKISRGRITKKVMTVDKIVRRWNSMYSAKESIRKKNISYIDTSVKPDYSDDEMDDSPTSDKDIDWNVYVLLFLRRYNMIKIHEVSSQGGRYYIATEIVDDRLRTNDNTLQAIIEQYREKEWDYYNGAFEVMHTAIKHSKNRCWSEMFYETYTKVSEYCAGCNDHDDIIQDTSSEYPLKVPVVEPLQILAEDQLALFKDARNIIVIPNEQELIPLLNSLLQYRLSTYVISRKEDVDIELRNMTSDHNLLLLNEKDLYELTNRHSYYYLSGIIAIKYVGTSREVYNLLQRVMATLGKQPSIRIVHILGENYYFDWLNKVFTDLVDGPVLPVDSIVS